MTLVDDQIVVLRLLLDDLECPLYHGLLRGLGQPGPASFELVSPPSRKSLLWSALRLLSLLVIQGFKSYKEWSQDEDFHPGHSVVVGRNGSGYVHGAAARPFGSALPCTAQVAGLPALHKINLVSFSARAASQTSSLRCASCCVTPEDFAPRSARACCTRV